MNRNGNSYELEAGESLDLAKLAELISDQKKFDQRDPLRSRGISRQWRRSSITQHDREITVDYAGRLQSRSFSYRPDAPIWATKERFVPLDELTSDCCLTMESTELNLNPEELLMQKEEERRA
jgi:hypothetical protein